MKNNRKNKINKLNFYIVDDEYINYLRMFDDYVVYNKNNKRPYVGIVINIENYQYFAPMFSPKVKHKNYKSNLSFFRIINKKNKTDLGIIRFVNMIPVPKEKIFLLDVAKESYKYRSLLSEQYSYINISENRNKILMQARKIYEIVTDNKNKTRMYEFYRNLSCDFKLLEKKCSEYIEKINLQN